MGSARFGRALGPAQPCPAMPFDGLGKVRSGSRPSPAMPCPLRRSASFGRALDPAQPHPALPFEGRGKFDQAPGPAQSCLFWERLGFSGAGGRCGHKRTFVSTSGVSARNGGQMGDKWATNGRQMGDKWTPNRGLVPSCRPVVAHLSLICRPFVSRSGRSRPMWKHTPFCVHLAPHIPCDTWMLPKPVIHDCGSVTIGAKCDAPPRLTSSMPKDIACLLGQTVVLRQLMPVCFPFRNDVCL